MEGLEERRRQWISVVNSRDLEGYAELVTEDVVWIPPGGAAIVGRPAFRGWLRPFFTSYTYQYSSSDPRYLDAGDWIVEQAGFESRMTPLAGGSPMSHNGSYIVIWRRDAGLWRIERYVDVGALSPDG